MIPPPDTDLAPAEQARWRLTRLAASLVRDYGVPADLVMADAAEGVALGRRALADTGRRHSVAAAATRLGVDLTEEDTEEDHRG